MSKGRLEAFSDGVLAIIITIMVLELKAPAGASVDALVAVAPLFVSYLFSFVFIGIYWNNHHHLFQAARTVDGRVLWANLHLLFWLSLIPVTTHWMGHTKFAVWPVAAYGMVLFAAAVAYSVLVRLLLALHGNDSLLAKAIGADVKGNLSLLLYAVGIATAFYSPLIAFGVSLIVAVLWLLPDRRIERVLMEAPPESG